MKILKSIKNGGKFALLFVASAGLGVALPYIAFDVNSTIHEKQGEELNLLIKGGHLSKGEHRVVFTDQFAGELMSFDDFDQNLAVKGIIAGFEELNKYNSSVKFGLYTTADALEKYGLEKIDKFSERHDIPLYISEGLVDNNEHAIASTTYNINPFTYELVDESITYRKYYMDAVFDYNFNAEDGFDIVSKSLIRTVTMHEGMHIMGFQHEQADSIMMPNASSKNTELTEKDKQNLDKYNMIFYSAEQTYFSTETDGQSKQAVKMAEKAEEGLEM